jgi:peptide/nickel transport system permease protein
MTPRFLRSRAARKFRRNRQAMLALGVIGVYLLVGLAALGADLVSMAKRAAGGSGLDPNTLVGMLTLESAEQVVGPAHVPPLGGKGSAQAPEKRLRDGLYYLGQYRKTLAGAERAGRRRMERDPSLTPARAEEVVVLPALREIRFAERRLVDASLVEVRARIDDADRLAAVLEASEDLDHDDALLGTLGEFETRVDGLFAPMGTLEGVRHWVRFAAGTDRQGRSVMVRGLYSIKVAFQVGFVVASLSVLVGTLVGAAAGFFGSWVDHLVVWLYSTLSSVPDLVLLTVLVFMFTGSIFDDTSRAYLSLVPLYAAMSMTFWIGPCRVVRGETLKIKQLEYVQAATAIGFGRVRILLRHVVPNTLHLVFINFSLLFIAAIKNEVVLSFLGLGVKVGPSWGRMISESSAEVITQIFWQIGTATVLMFGLVLAFNIVSDALQDAFDPKHVD